MFRKIGSAVFVLSALGVFADEEVRIRPEFDGSRVSNYQKRTFIATGATAGDSDFTVTCTQTGKCETAWGIFSLPVRVPDRARSYVWEFEIRADADWINPETSGKHWDNAVNWMDAGGKKIDRRRLSLEFKKGDFARFRFVGKVPDGAKKVDFQFGVDAPNLPPGQKVEVRNSLLTFLGAGSKVPSELIPDRRAPVVFSRFESPSEDPETEAVYEIRDYTAVDWRSLAVTDAVTKAGIPYVRSGGRITLRPKSPWKAGRNLIDVHVRDVLGNSAVSRKAFMIGEKRRAPVVTLRDDGMTLVEGRAFFPVGMYSVSPCAFNGENLDTAVRDLKRAGINMVHSYGNRFDPKLFAAAKKYGVMQWTSGHGAYQKGDSWFMTTGRTDRTVLAWYIGDDTSMYAAPGTLLDRDEAVRMLDGTRITCHADGVRAKAAKSNFQEYVNYADVFLPEIYPIDGFRDELCVAEVCRDMDRCRADIRDYGDGRPRGLWPILQCFHGKGWKRYPTAQEMYAMSFAALIHGGNGITWFKYGGEIGEKKARYSGMFRTESDWNAMTNIISRISELAPVLLERTPVQPPTPEIVSGAKNDGLGKPAVTTLMKHHANSTYILAVNAAKEKVCAEFRAPVAGKGEVMWEQRSVVTGQGRFRDDFEPFAVHVYRFKRR